MNTAGIICEYNPFHNGHQKQFRLVRNALGADAAIICLMSGSFVQRGAPALFDRSVRAEAAVRGGADLVLELPVTYALRSAEGFAAGGVELLSALGIADALSFGCETPDRLWETAQLLESPEFPPLLRRHLDTGLSFAAARTRALEALGGDGGMIAQPNNILGVEYCKAILRQGSRLKILPLTRGGAYHDPVPEPENPSASSLRTIGDFLPYVPPKTRMVYESAPRYRLACGERAMLARLRALSEEEFSRVPYGSEGLWRKVRRACLAGGSVQDILAEAKSKRYPHTRLCRLLLCAYLGISAAMLEAPAPYVRVLALGARGGQLLRAARERGRIPLLNAGARAEDTPYAQLERQSTLLYDLFCEEPCVQRARQERVFVLPAQE